MNADAPSPQKAALERAARLLGSQAALATLLGFQDRRNVSPWFTTDRPFPEEHCPPVERALREKGGEVVTCEELRPDISWLRIPHPEWPNGKPLVDYAGAA